MTHRLGIDIGGTFTDFALVDDSTGELSVYKQLTTPQDPSASVLSGCATLLDETGVSIADIATMVHGTTLVTNAVIERRGAITGMLVTRGFRDVLDIAMERRYDLFDLRLRFAEPVRPRGLRAEIDERVMFNGTIGTALDGAEVESAVARLVDAAEQQQKLLYVDAHDGALWGRNVDVSRRFYIAAGRHRETLLFRVTGFMSEAAYDNILGEY